MAAGVGGLGVGLAWPKLGQAAALSHDLTIQPARYALRDGVMTDGLVSLSADAPPPVIRGKKGVPLRLNVTNAMPDYTAMHWHGLRIPNGMDGVPYLTQFPIAEGETFAYEFTPPDAGTYWYHPHCMTMSQMAHGLTGVMVIDEESDPGFDGDEVVNLRDFRLQDDGSFLPYFTPRGAARSGTFGNVQTANWLQQPVYDHPAGGLVRLRVVNTDTTRIY
jgi:FtsP/CotA-like multicopper oxidase with cupredoxin domain